MKAPTKAELYDKIKQLEELNQTIIQCGLEFQRRFESAYMILNRIKHLQDWELRLDIDNFINQYEIIQTQTYGPKVVPKVAPKCL